MKKYNSFSFVGVTKEDRKVLDEHESQEIEVYVDHYFQAWNEGGQYIADVKIVV